MSSPIVVILGAGQPFVGTDPSALIQTSGDQRVLDWILDAFEQSLDDPEIHFVGGYRLDEVVDAYPEIHFSQNEEWEETGTVESLFTAPIQGDRPIYVCYADTVFERSVVEALDGVNAVAVDRTWQTRYRSRSNESLERAEKVKIADGHLADADNTLSVEEADAEFTGVVRLTADAVGIASSLWDSRTLGPDANLPDLLRALLATGTEVEAVDIGGRWAELEQGRDLSRFVLDTKANTLKRLESMVSKSSILSQYTFTVGRWNEDPTKIQTEIQNEFNGDAVIVRSSALVEDSWDESNAGRFESILDVPTTNPGTLSAAIQQVIDSYPDDNPDNQVLVQPMIADVAQSGVVMTRTIDTGGPYYVINYDATTASTESVTDGTGEHLQTAIVRKDLLSHGRIDIDEMETGSPQTPVDIPLKALLAAVNELEELVGHDSLDIEFAIDAANEIYVLQTRPMTLDPGENTVNDETVFEAVDRGRSDFQTAQPTPPTLFGERTIYGVMPDWNPAEIIGRHPRPLAASLYRDLIMNETWAQQRAEYGYRDVRPHPLMRSVAGQPFVDVRADFNSFIPASVPDELAERLVTYYLQRLEDYPEFHDKVEFEILLTCLPVDYVDRIKPLLDAGFTREELQPLREGLQEINRSAFGRIQDDLATIDRLAERHDDIVTADLEPLDTAYHLLHDCRRLGTLPFAHLARTAFVATSLLRSFERSGVLSSEDVERFQNSLNTVARQFERDGYRVAQGELPWETFVEEYGHLRPGTYEITSPAYHNAPEEYLLPTVETAEPPSHPGEPNLPTDKLAGELNTVGWEGDASDFVEFLVEAIEGREYAKFVFSRNLSEALERIAAFGEQHGFTREELSYVAIESFNEIVLDPPAADLDTWLARRVNEGREKAAVTRSVELPPLLFSDADFLVFERPAREPNYVTSRAVRAETTELNGRSPEDSNLDGCIVMIPQADPGFDWLFGHDIAGLITMYGGANSHMAVRAAEFSLPAAIGVGERLYEQLRRAEVLELDCGGHTLRIIQ